MALGTAMCHTPLPDTSQPSCDVFRPGWPAGLSTVLVVILVELDSCQGSAWAAALLGINEPSSSRQPWPV
eukprot:364781-Chlamydomonas_euryale.AAC.8